MMPQHLSEHMCRMAPCTMAVPQSARTAAMHSLGPAMLFHATRLIIKQFSQLSEAPSMLWKQPVASATAPTALQLLGRKHYVSSNEARKPSFTFDECVAQVHLSGGPSVSLADVTEAMARAAGAATQLAPRAEKRLWVLVECGEWRSDAQLPPGMRPGVPAKAVFLITDPVERKKGHKGTSKGAAIKGYSVFPFMLIERGLPTGEVFKDRWDRPSPTTMEQLTTRHRSKKFASSCRVVVDNKPVCKLAIILKEFALCGDSEERPLMAAPKKGPTGRSKAAPQQTVFLRPEQLR